jgi:Protein of unknown function (DUF732)
VRDRETIDAELRLIAAARRSMREQGGQASYRQADALLDERLGHLTHSPEIEATQKSEAAAVSDMSRNLVKTSDIRRHLRKTALRRFGPLAALPLSLIAIAGVAVMMFAVHRPDPVAQPAEPPPSSAPPNPVPPKAPVPQLDIVDRAFIDVLKRDGVPVPSHEYVTTHGHAVCDFLTHQSNFAEAVGFVQQSSIWDANQSADFTAGAVVSYCPQYEAANTDQMQQTNQKALTDLQAIQGHLQGIQGDLQGIRDGLQGIPGHQ